jgi:hypothetical protein
MSRLAPLASGLLLLALAMGACPGTDPPDDDDVYEGAVIIDVAPPDGAPDFLFTSTLFVHFDPVPDEATAELTTAAGGAVGVAVALSADGTELRVDPFVPLEPSTDYVWSVSFTPSSVDSIGFSFRTGPYGAPVEVDPAGMIGRTFRFEIDSGDLTEPPGGAGIIASFLTATPILLSLTAESSFAAEDQPGLYVLGALGTLHGDGEVTQSVCRGTASMSAGDDLELGTADDTPSWWKDPFLQLGPYHLPLNIAGVLAGIYDLDLRWTVHPQLIDWEDGSFSGNVDTRWLDDLVPGAGEKGTACELLAAIDLTCEECPAGDAGPFCIGLRAEGLRAVEVPGLVLEVRDCADTIGLFQDSGECAEDAAAFDPDGDGTYSLCSEWTGR